MKRLFLLLLLSLPGLLLSAQKRTEFRPGEIWPDDKGVHINAHGGGILTYRNVYYWFGEHKTEGRAGNSAHVGVHCYSSKDLYNWKDEGIALRVSEDPDSDIADGCILERPKVIYNAKTKKFVMWFHLEPKGNGYGGAMVGIAQADKVTGPYTFIRSTRATPGMWPVNVLPLHKQPVPEKYQVERSNLGRGEHPDSVNTLGRDFLKGQHSRDMTLFVDDDGKAYHICSSESNSVIHINQLTDDYLDFSGIYARAFIGEKMEAPAIFKKDGLYYFMGSECTGWRPNPAHSAVAPSIWGPWTDLGNPCVDEDSQTTYHSQSTFFIPVAGKEGQFIYMGDRWTPDNAIDGRYIWLPVEFEDGRFVLHWYDSWTLDGPRGRNSALETYPSPEGPVMNDDFTVEVKIHGGEWQSVPTYMVQVDEVRGAEHHFEKSSVGYFDFSGTVDVRVTFNKGKVSRARVRPLSFGIEPVVKDNTLTFSLSRPRNLSVEVNGDIFHNLHLFAGPIDERRPQDLSDPDLIYFGPGYHELPRSGLKVGSGKTVYVAGGAYVKGQIRVDDAENVRVLGRGIVRPENGAGVSVSRSRNVEVEGIIVTQCPVGGSDGVTVRNVKSITHFGWGDGMNVFASSNVLFDGVFCRNSDDCTTVYATRKGFTGSSRHIVMKNSTLWADVAHPIFIGIHGNVEAPDTIEDVAYENIDILDHKEKQLDYQGCLAINGGDENIIRDIRFENIRIEDFREGQIFNIRIFFNEKYCKAPGQVIENILFKNVEYRGRNANVSQIIGYDASRKVKNIRFEGLRINGTLISDDMPGKPKWYKTGDMGRIFIGEHVENVEFVR